MADIDPTSRTWRHVSDTSNEKVTALIKLLLKKGTPVEQYVVLRAQIHEHVSILRLDPAYKSELFDE